MLLLAIRFLAELAGVAGLAYVGATVPADAVWRLVLGLGGPAVLVAVWALVVAPKASNPLPARGRELIGTGLLVLVGVLLAAAGEQAWGIALATVVVVDQVLLLAVGRSGTTAPASGGRA